MHGTTNGPRFTDLMRDTIEVHGLAWALRHYARRMPAWELRLFARIAYIGG